MAEDICPRCGARFNADRCPCCHDVLDRKNLRRSCEICGKYLHNEDELCRAWDMGEYFCRKCYTNREFSIKAGTILQRPVVCLREDTVASDPISLYTRHYVDKQDERLELFRVLVDRFEIETALYPGSFVHITPSLFISKVVYVDTDRRARSFFGNPEVLEYVSKRRTYEREPEIQFHGIDYRREIDEPKRSFDLLVSHHAGFVSLYCGDYLGPGGILLANNSHGDASMASIDGRFELVGVVKRRDQRFSLSEEDLNDYFVPKRPLEITREYLLERQQGIGYERSAYSYLFRRS
jgi:hypothetical protein